MLQRTAAIPCLIAALSFLGIQAQARPGVDELVRESSFDGAKSETAPVPAALPAPPEVGAPVGVKPPGRSRTKQSGDLFYFTPEEADLGARMFTGKPKAGSGFTFDSDVPQDIQAQMLGDLGFVGGIQGQGASPLHQQIFGGVDGSAYKRFFETRVRSVGMDDCGSAGAVACVMPYWDSSKMWLTQNYIQFSHPQIARLMIIFHEARHTETKNRNWPHASCPTPFLDADGKDMRSIWTGSMLEGQPACDSTPFGSYGSSSIMLKNVQKRCASCTDKVKMDAGLYGDDQLGRITDAGARRQIKEDLER